MEKSTGNGSVQDESNKTFRSPQDPIPRDGACTREDREVSIVPVGLVCTVCIPWRYGGVAVSLGPKYEILINQAWLESCVVFIIYSLQVMNMQRKHS